MKTSLGLKLGQSLTMTPALQQAIRLLQLSSLDLKLEIQDALDSNLMLERDEDADELAPAGPDGPESAADDPSEVDSIPDQPDSDFEWDDVYGPSGSTDRKSEEALYEFRQASLHALPDLREHLLEQARLHPFTQRQGAVAGFLIDAIDDRGYLVDWDDVAPRAGSATGAPAAEVSAVLATIQDFDPPGVAARDLAECLGNQLRQMPTDRPGVELAALIIRDHLEDLAQNKPDRLARALGVSPAELDQAQQLITRLQPNPGTPFHDLRTEYVAPDVYVRKAGHRWAVSLNPEVTPRLRINAQYQQLIRRADTSPDQQTLRQHLQEARYFLNSLKSRNETLIRVAQEIVDQQRAFLEYGDEAMKPMVLRDIAERLGVHESTVSRTTAHKYMLTPRGLYELKFFFSSSVRTTEGGSCSATAIQAMIRRLVGAEDASHPLSDSRLTQLLLSEGVRVARRTVAKYREGLGIPPSHERRQLA